MGASAGVKGRFGLMAERFYLALGPGREVSVRPDATLAGADS